MSTDEKVPLTDLSKRDEIIVMNAGKGSAVVIIDINDYTREAKCQLNDLKNYKVFAKDPTITNNNLINQAIYRCTKKATQVILW